MKNGISLITLDKVAFQYPGSDKQILNNIDFSFREGEKVGIVGDNGCGKSTIAKLILGIERPAKGRVLYRGKPVKWNKHYPQIAYIGDPGHSEELQGLPNYLTVGRIVEIFKSVLKISSGNIPQKDLYDLLGIENLLGKYTHRLSTGERKRVMTYLALTKPNRLLILDEPFDGLDRETKDLLLEKLNTFLHPETTLLYIAHNRMEIDLFTEKVFALKEGNIIRTPQARFIVSTSLNGGPAESRLEKTGQLQYNLNKLLENGSSDTICLQIKPSQNGNENE